MATINTPLAVTPPADTNAAAATGLIVPIRVEALPIGQKDTPATGNVFLPALIDAAPLANRATPYLGSSITTAPWTGGSALTDGIYLHWNLPRGLREGTVGEASSGLDLQPVPDRWLVTRIVFNPGGGAPDIESFVVESNYVATTKKYSSTSFPLEPAGNQSPPPLVGYLGRVYPLADWLTEGQQGTYQSPLTAMGFGIPDFAGYLPNCTNVFGLQDSSVSTISGYVPGQSSIAYVVTGWYSVASQDPLNGADAAANAAALGWDGPQGTTPGTVPGFTLCHGVVYGLTWDPTAGYIPQNQSAGIEVGFGNTAAEAFAALVAKQQKMPSLEDTLNAFQLGALNRIGGAGALAKIGRALYDESFSRYDGGSVWQLQPAQAAAGGSAPTPGPLTAAVQTALATLNTAQQTLDQETAVLASLQTQLFQDWGQLMQLSCQPVPSEKPAAATLSNQISDLTSLVQAEAVAIANLQAKVTSDQAAVNSQSAALAGNAAVAQGWQLVQQPAERFSMPADPVLLLCGGSLPLPPPDETDSLPCRLATAIPGQMTLAAGTAAGSLATPLPASALPAVQAAGVPAPVLALVQEALLLLPAGATWLASVLAGLKGTGNPAVIDQAGTATAISSDQTACLAGKTPTHLSWSGTLPYVPVEYRAWAFPFNPVSLVWEVNLYAVTMPTGSTAPAFVTSSFTFNPATLNQELNAGVEGSTTAQPYSGMVLLSPGAGTQLKRQLEACDAVGGSGAAALRTSLAGYPMLAQAVSGFHAALVQRGAALHLPVADPYQIVGLPSLNSVVNATTEAAPYAALPTSIYQPLLGGTMEFTRIGLVDQFGRYQTVDSSGMAVGNRIPMTGGATPMMAPPLRLAQPSRLNFSWLPGTAGGSTDDPVCGWLVPNHLDQSLMLYGPDGSGIGSIVATGGTPVWQPVPGGKGAATLQAAMTGANPVLAAFANQAFQNGSAYIAQMLAAISESRIFIQPTGDLTNGATAVLMGQPLALVQASLSLELQGLPAPNQTVATVAADAAKIAKSYNGKGYEAVTVRSGIAGPVSFPVTLGGLTQVDDGLVGFFAPSSPGAAVDYAIFYSPAVSTAQSGVNPPGAQTLAVALPAGGAGGQAVTITMLVDPRCPVHAYDGIHPVGSLSIAPAVYAPALAGMSFVFLAAPLLSLSGQPEIPIPAEAAGSWSWTAPNPGGTGWTSTAVSPVTYAPTLAAPKQIVEGWIILSEQEGASQ